MTGTLDAVVANEILRVSPLGVIVLGADGKVEWNNPAAESLLGMKNTELLGRGFDDIQSRIMEPTAEEVLFRINRQDESALYLVIRKHKSTTHILVTLSDATELLRAQEDNQSLTSQLREKDPADPLTGLMNRRALLQAFGAQVSRSRRYHNPLSIISLELTDGAVSAEDVDKALVAVSQYLRDQLRWVDLIGRTGNEQFTLVLPETGKDDALKLAHKLEERMHEVTPLNAEGIKQRIVMGVTSWGKGDDVSIMLKRLDQALTSARALGAPAIEFR